MKFCSLLPRHSTKIEVASAYSLPGILKGWVGRYKCLCPQERIPLEKLGLTISEMPLSANLSQESAVASSSFCLIESPALSKKPSP